MTCHNSSYTKMSRLQAPFRPTRKSINDFRYFDAKSMTDSWPDWAPRSLDHRIKQSCRRSLAGLRTSLPRFEASSSIRECYLCFSFDHADVGGQKGLWKVRIAGSFYLWGGHQRRRLCYCLGSSHRWKIILPSFLRVVALIKTYPKLLLSVSFFSLQTSELGLWSFDRSLYFSHWSSCCSWMVEVAYSAYYSLKD